MRRGALGAALVCLASGAVGATVDEQASLSAARKFQQIASRSLPAGTTVEISEGELNAFLRFHGAALIPAGVQNPRLALREGGAEFSAKIDLEKAGTASESLPFMMRLLLRGTREVAADVDYGVRDGRAAARIVRLTIEGVEIPPEIVQWFVEAFAPAELRPYLSADGHEVDAGLRDLEIAEGSVLATVD